MLLEIKLKKTDFVFTQDGASSYTLKKKTFLNTNCQVLIEPNNWPSFSPDLNPIDYFM